MNVNLLVKSARTGALAAFHAAQNVGNSENWVVRLRVEAFGAEVAAEIAALSQSEAAKLRAEAIQVFESLLSADDRARIEAGRRASMANDSDVESESMKG